MKIGKRIKEKEKHNLNNPKKKSGKGTAIHNEKRTHKIIIHLNIK